LTTFIKSGVIKEFEARKKQILKFAAGIGQSANSTTPEIFRRMPADLLFVG
jgi:hypothetical protein